ncbi:MAG: hypothetical protein ACJAZO_003907 [Myxococcota bacterium]|jgi:hypothetical protein
MIRTLAFTLSLLLSGCGGLPTTTPSEPAVEHVPLPAEWAFLDATGLRHIAVASDTAFITTLEGRRDDIISTAVAGAEQAGWQQANRTENSTSISIYFDGSDGSQLAISISDDANSLHRLSVAISPPE